MKSALKLTIFIFLSQVSLRTVSSQSQVSLKSVSGQSQVSLRSVSGQSQDSIYFPLRALGGLQCHLRDELAVAEDQPVQPV